MDLKSLNKSTLVNIAITVLLLLCCIWVYRFQMQKYHELEQAKEYETKKNAVIERISRLEKKLFAYKKLLAQKEATQLVNAISRAASASAIQINSIQPQPIEEQEYYKQISVNLNILAKRYHDLGKFISMLEKSPEIFTAKVVKITSKGTKETETLLNVTLTVTSLIYKE